MKDIIVGIASLSEREECLKDTIESLYDQSNKIIVTLNNYNSIPDFLKREKIECILSDNSIGAMGKFMKIKEYKDCYYFSCDDDIIYPDNYISKTIKKMNENGYDIVTYHGSNLNRPITTYFKSKKLVGHFSGNLEEDIEVEIGGTGVMCINTEKLNFDITKEDAKWWKHMVDLFISNESRKKDIQIFLLEHKFNFLKYNEKMNKKWTIYETYSKNDISQTNIVKSWRS